MVQEVAGVGCRASGRVCRRRGSWSRVCRRQKDVRGQAGYLIGRLFSKQTTCSCARGLTRSSCVNGTRATSLTEGNWDGVVFTMKTSPASTEQRGRLSAMGRLRSAARFKQAWPALHKCDCELFNVVLIGCSYARFTQQFAGHEPLQSRICHSLPTVAHAS